MPTHTVTERIYDLNSERATLAFGKALAQICQPPAILFLSGELGTGKTTIVRGFLQAHQYLASVKSPTYSLVESYHLADGVLQPNPLIVNHFDLYRLRDPAEIAHLGIHDYFTNSSIALIEWPERAEGVLPNADLHMHLDYAKKGRRLRLTALTTNGKKWLNLLDFKK